jgi:UDP-glucuronate 4-epimerase
MLVCVTGGLGFIGSHLSDALLDRGRRVRCVDRLSGVYAPGSGADAAAALRKRGAEVIEADLANVDPGALLDGADAVVHLAALPGVRTRRPFGELWAENVVASERIAAAAERAGARMVLASTSSVYGDADRLPTPEHAPTSPLNAYAASKVAAERAVRAAAADAVVVRLFTVYGPRQRPDMAFARWIAALAEGRPLAWHAHDDTARDFTHVGDTVRGIVAALDRGRAGETYNIAGGRPVRLAAALALLEQATERSAAVERSPAPAADALVTCGSAAKARAELGWEPHVALAAGLREQVEDALGPYAEPASRRAASSSRRTVPV